jgi:hypothetical protein
MTKEMRVILFSSEELTEAALDHHQAMSAPPHFQVASKIEFNGLSPVTAQVEMRRWADKRCTPVHFNSDDLTRAVIRLCHKKKIPLAIRANKTLDVIGDRLGLIVSMGWEVSAQETIVARSRGRRRVS